MLRFFFIAILVITMQGCGDREPETVVTVSERVKVPTGKSAANTAASQIEAGTAALKAGQVRRAYGHFTLATELDKNSWTAWHGLGRTHLELKSPEKALPALDNALELSNRDLRPLFSLGLAYFDLRRYRDAIDVFSEVAQRNPTTCEAIYNVGVSRINLNQWEAAIEPVQRAISCNPDNRQYHSSLAEAAGRSERWEDGQKSLDWLSAREPSEKVSDLKARYERRRWQLPASADAAQAFASVDEALNSSRQEADFKVARSQITAALQRWPGDYRLLGRRALLDVELGDFKQAREALEVDNAVARESWDGAYAAGRVALIDRKWLLAQRNLEATLTDKNEPWVHYWLAEALWGGGSREGALARLEIAISKEPPDVATYHLRRGDMLFAMGSFDRASSALDTALEADGENIEALMQKVNVSLAQDRVDLARGYAAKLKKFPDARSLAARARGDILTYQGRLASAREEYTAAIQANSLDIWSVFSRGRINYISGNFRAAADDIRDALTGIRENSRIPDPVNEAFIRIWLYLTTLEITERSTSLAEAFAADAIELTRNLRGAWPSPLLAFLASGQTGPDPIDAARLDPRIARDRLNEAYFYIGAYYLYASRFGANRLKDARENLQKSIDTNARHYIEWHAARALLKTDRLALRGSSE